MTSEPTDPKLRQSLKHKAYPVREARGFIWVWMGYPEEMYEFEAPAWAPSATTKTSIAKLHAACNRAQILEGSIDSAHGSSLHSSDMAAAAVEGSTATETAWLRPSMSQAPRLQVQLTDWGFRYVALRIPRTNPETHYHVA